MPTISKGDSKPKTTIVVEFTLVDRIISLKDEDGFKRAFEMLAAQAVAMAQSKLKLKIVSIVSLK